MTAAGPRPRPVRRGRRRAAATALAVVVALLVGVALGMTLERGSGGRAGTRTIVGKLDPRPLGPPPRTVTVTVTG